MQTSGSLQLTPGLDLKEIRVSDLSLLEMSAGRRAGGSDLHFPEHTGEEIQP